MFITAAAYLIKHSIFWQIHLGGMLKRHLRYSCVLTRTTGPNTDFEEGCLGVRDAANDAGYSTADVEAAFAQVGLCPGYVPPAPVDLDIALDNTQLNWAVSGDGIGSDRH